MRFRYRHVHKTVCAYIESELTAKGWVNDPVNFNETAVRFQEIQPEENGDEVLPNLVAITMGDGPESDIEELGGGAYSLPYVVFIDVYGTKGSVAVSIAEDIRDSIDFEKSISVYDFTDPTTPVEQLDYITFERVIGPERPPASVQSQDFRKHWRVVKATARVYYTP